MASWIKERADEVRRIEKQRKEDFDRKVVAASDLKTLLRPLWKELVETVDQSIREFNSEFPEANRKIDPFEKGADTFAIRRVAYPSVLVKAQLNPAGTAVQYSISQVLRKGANTVERQAAFSYRAGDGQPAYSDTNLRSHEDVAKVLLEPFFEF